MGAPRKIFRIEEMAASPRAHHDSVPAEGLGDILHELGTLRALLTGTPRQSAGSAPRRNDELERLSSKLQLIRLTISGADQDGSADGGLPASTEPRIARELEAVIEGSEQATQKILTAAEEIDQAANTLSAAVKSGAEQGLAQDIRDRVIAIFEACNYQDLTSQRVAKVMASLARIEQQIARTLEDLARAAAPPLHGPRLEGDRGHVTQGEVDTMFDGSEFNSA
jgi:chemotaxis protein CheZ